MRQLELRDLLLTLKYTWKISRNSSDHKHNFLVILREEGREFLGEVAPNVRYGENPEKIRNQFNRIEPELHRVQKESQLQELLEAGELCQSLRFGIESAFIHYFAYCQHQSLAAYLQWKAPSRVYTSYTIPILPPSEIGAFVEAHQLKRFKSLKLKVGQEGMVDMVRALSDAYSGSLRIDANEAWSSPDALLKELEKLKKYNIECLEQPFAQALISEYQYLKKNSPFPLIADESITYNPDFEEIENCFHGINMKLMKAGGYRNGIKILQEARNRGLLSMVGCMIETTVGIFSGFNLCNEVNYIDLDGFFVVENEPFKLISEENGALFI
ncbi:MAG: dipeptide epimerase [Cytophagaceae bacterium]|jgi:glutamate racemase|nr:dipeptide epimerase [Cytophagaceae bacterium]